MKKYILLFLSINIFSFNSLAQELAGDKINCAPIVKATSSELMQHWVNYWPANLKKRNKGLGLEEPNRENLPQAPSALELAQWPISENPPAENPLAPQTLGISFTGATLADALAVPPDVMGDVGPTQYLFL